MAKLSIKVDGLNELGASMKALGDETAVSVARSMTNSAAQLVKKDAIARAPQSDEPHRVEDTEVQPGNLKKNIIVRRLPPARSDVTSEHIVTVRGKKRDGYAARYGRLVEHGTVNTSPQPFLRPALDENVTAAINAMKKSGTDGVARAVRKVSRGAKRAAKRRFF